MIEITIPSTQELIANNILHIANKFDCEWECKIDLTAGELSIRISAKNKDLDKKLAIDTNLFEFESKGINFYEHITKWLEFYFEKKTKRHLHLLEG